MHVMGPEVAAVTVAAMLQRFDRIANPGGYLRALSAKAASGGFSPGPMVMALLQDDGARSAEKLTAVNSHQTCSMTKIAILCRPKETAMSTMNISLPDPMKAWVEDQARSGRYANSSDYVRDLIRRDRARVEAMSELQSAIDTGLASGPATALNRAAFKARMRAQHDKP